MVSVGTYASHYLQQYENALAGDKAVTKGTRRTIAVSPSITFFGNQFDIQDDVTVILNEKDRYTHEELWQNSVARISVTGMLYRCNALETQYRYRLTFSIAFSDYDDICFNSRVVNLT